MARRALAHSRWNIPDCAPTSRVGERGALSVDVTDRVADAMAGGR
jgi:hypothetical protein